MLVPCLDRIAIIISYFHMFFLPILKKVRVAEKSKKTTIMKSGGSEVSKIETNIISVCKFLITKFEVLNKKIIIRRRIMKNTVN